MKNLLTFAAGTTLFTVWYTSQHHRPQLTTLDDADAPTPAVGACPDPPAVTHLQQALGAALDRSDEAAAAELRLALARLALGRGAYEQAAEYGEQSGGVHGGLVRLEALTRGGWLLQADELARELAEQQVELVAQSMDNVLIWARVSHLWGNIRRDAGIYKEAEERYDEAEKHFWNYEDDHALALLELDRAESQRRQGQAAQARQRLARAIDFVEKQQPLRQQAPTKAPAEARHALALAALDAGDTAAAGRMLTKILEDQQKSCDSLHHPDTVMTLAHMADAQLYTGNPDGARATLELASKTLAHSRSFPPDVRAHLLALQADVAEASELDTEAVTHAENAVEVLAEAHGPMSLGLVVPLITLSKIALREGDSDTANLGLVQALAIVEATSGTKSVTGAAVLSMMADIAQQEHRYADAIQHYQGCIEAASFIDPEVPDSAAGSIARAMASRAEARVAQGDPDFAMRMLRSKCGQWSR